MFVQVRKVSLRLHRKAARVMKKMGLGKRARDYVVRNFDTADCVGRIEAAIEEGRAEHGFNRVGEHRRPARAASDGPT